MAFVVPWPDAARERESLIPDLLDQPPVCSLGSYDPTEGRGPMSWLRYMVARVLPDAPKDVGIIQGGR